ncbi:MAG: hypothetical protein Q4B42_05275 [Oscillospiraceae bacterium]|nr:hypothetical protein [Oscillospiraceae bacterium]
MDIEKIVKSLTDTLNNDGGLLESFKEDPAATVKKLVNMDLDSETLKAIVTVVKTKLLGDKTDGLMDALGGLLGK